MLNYILTVTLSQSWSEKVIRDEANTKSFVCPLRDHPRNSTVPVLEFIEYEDWCFVVMQICDGFREVPFRNAAKVLDFAEQVLSISSRLF
jgi:hypothetical protein